MGTAYDFEILNPSGGGSGVPVTIEPPSAIDPAGPSSDGDLYYNTGLKEWMGYDSSRSKWLSLASFTILAR